MEGVHGPEEPVAEGVVRAVVPVGEDLGVDGIDGDDVAVGEVGGGAEIHLRVGDGAEQRGVAEMEKRRPWGEARCAALRMDWSEARCGPVGSGDGRLRGGHALRGVRLRQRRRRWVCRSRSRRRRWTTRRRWRGSRSRWRGGGRS